MFVIVIMFILFITTFVIKRCFLTSYESEGDCKFVSSKRDLSPIYVHCRFSLYSDLFSSGTRLSDNVLFSKLGSAACLNFICE